MGPIRTKAAFHSQQRSQRGIALIMTLIMLVIMTISALGMMLMVNSGVSTAGNIAFRQAAVRAADMGAEAARIYILGKNETYLQAGNDEASGYYANYQAAFDPRTFDFSDPTKAKKYTVGTVDTFYGYKIYYVIHRMALTTGPCNENAGCFYPPTASSAGTGQGSSQSGGSTYTGNVTGEAGKVYYRATVKVVGSKYNNRYIQAFFY